MVTAYDYPSARAARGGRASTSCWSATRGAMTVLGYPSTVAGRRSTRCSCSPRAVRRGLTTPFLIGDLPFGSYEVSDEQAVHRAALRQGGGLRRVKLEGGGPMSVARAKAIVGAGIPVMGHVGLTPQTSTALGGYRAQGRTAARRERIAREALALQEAGCFSLVFEAIPRRWPRRSWRTIEIPVIGIGAGPSTDGQVLVFHDLLGIREGRGARFVKRYADLQDEMDAGVAAYAEDVRTRRYPGPEHGYSIPDEELAASRRAARPARRRARERPVATARAFHTAFTRYPARPMARLTQVFARRDREFFDLFEEAGAERRARRPTSSTRCSRAIPTAPTSRATSSSASRRATGSPTTSTSG